MNRDQSHETSRRGFVKTAVYVAPLILSLRADSAYASYGSGDRLGGNQGVGRGLGRKPGETPAPGTNQGGSRGNSGGRGGR
jgi:hypothetical protein